MRKKRYREPYKQGVYKPMTDKYKGSQNPIYRSSWELKFFKWCDDNINVVEWTSESVVIPYTSPLDNRTHRYIVDNTVKILEYGKLVKYLIEIKPKKQTTAPKAHGNKKQSTILYENMNYIRNTAKWKAAEAWCKRRGYKFQIITEDHLFHS
jgi:hypothetical protein